MSLIEQRKAVKAKIDKLKRARRKTSDLIRQYEILTAGVIAEKMAADKAKPSLPAEAFQPCHLARPDLWEAFCRVQNRPNDPSDHWTTFDVVLLLTRKLLEASRTPDGRPALPN